MNTDILSLQAIIIGVAVIILVLVHNSWRKRTQRKRDERNNE